MAAAARGRRAKIVATLGPASDGLEAALVAAGLDVARLNFSHGSLDDHLRRCRAVREAARQQGRAVAVIQDLQGPRIRVGNMVGGQPISLVVGQPLVFVAGDTEGTSERVSTTYDRLANDVAPGDLIWLDDGHLRVRVLAVSGAEVHCEVEAGGLLGEHKGMNLPKVKLSVPTLTSADREQIAFGARELHADYVALSFVRSGDDILEAKQLINEAGGEAEVIAKIEMAEAISNLTSVVEASDAVMVARGDLGVELGPENVPAQQKHIVQRANGHNIPVIVATQMLESMTKDEIPTRAEASDVANAVWDGADALMLSAETAAGRHPVRVVEMMDRIIRSAESAPQQAGFFRRSGQTRNDAAALTDAACVLSSDLRASAIVGLTRTGRTAHLLSYRRPAAPIFAFSPDADVCSRLALWWGVTPVHLRSVGDFDANLASMEKYLLESGIAAAGDPIVVTGAHPFRLSVHTNFVKHQRLGQGDA